MSSKTEFRGMRKNGEWLFGNLVQFENFTCIFPFDADWMCVVQRDRRISPEYIVIRETVGEFIGFTDRVGKKVFEGDKVKGASNTYTIYRSDVIAGFVLATPKSNQPITNTMLLYLSEVTGNIHDKQK